MIRMDTNKKLTSGIIYATILSVKPFGHLFFSRFNTVQQSTINRKDYVMEACGVAEVGDSVFRFFCGPDEIANQIGMFLMRHPDLEVCALAPGRFSPNSGYPDPLDYVVVCKKKAK